VIAEPDALAGEIALQGRIMPASNATFFGVIGELPVVYKPIAGERPLWDFPEGTLAAREVASWEVSEFLGWNVVPLTFLRDGPHGAGMVQLWQEPAPELVAVDIVPAGAIPPGWHRVFDGLDEDHRDVSLVHEDSPALRRMALFDVLVNNADRKGGHVLAMSDGHRFGVDHGLTFHVEDKLRTVLWGWPGDPLTPHEVADVERLAHGVRSDLGERLGQLITRAEVRALEVRCSSLIREGSLPLPGDRWPAIPWPPI
jgi:uncharacterized repeat protein (TIGR03843 family)